MNNKKTIPMKGFTGKMVGYLQQNIDEGLLFMSMATDKMLRFEKRMMEWKKDKKI